ncbi:hypothetical protein SAMN05444580_10120 [Rhodococcus tukisamuensis]|uniref:Histone deacetylase n=1 Tax=Rhodococcus tukisamuensis TaxID=168276 RepID=A0A1G6M026_9NOCA|nr:hypothetical protein SAMN05444580_10120 [Rhodococcus tukisamuensis]
MWPPSTVGCVLIWYVSYGSNMSIDRLGCYLRGGRPAGGRRTQPGARDGRAPRESAPVLVPGRVFFAGRSRVWGGGRAFYDPDEAGRVAARAYLLTAEQFDDVRSQEPECYDRVLELGRRGGLAMRTFTCRARGSTAVHTAPSPAYLRALGAGLQEAHGWDAGQVADYLAAAVSWNRPSPVPASSRSPGTPWLFLGCPVMRATDQVG